MSGLTARGNAKFLKLADSAEEPAALARADAQRISELRRQASVSSAETRANIEHEIARRRGKMEEHQLKYTGRINALAKIKYCIENTPANRSFVDVPLIEPTEHEGDYRGAVIHIRQEIHSATLGLKVTQRAAPPIAERKDAATKYVLDLKRRLPPKMKATHEKFSITFSDPTSYTPKINIAAFMAWYDAEGFIARLHAEIDAMPKAELELSAADKEARIAEIRAALLEMERREEAMIEAAAKYEGQIIERRVDADPLAVLGVDIVRAEQSAA